MICPTRQPLPPLPVVATITTITTTITIINILTILMIIVSRVITSMVMICYDQGHRLQQRSAIPDYVRFVFVLKQRLLLVVNSTRISKSSPPSFSLTTKSVLVKHIFGMLPKIGSTTRHDPKLPILSLQQSANSYTCLQSA